MRDVLQKPRKKAAQPTPTPTGGTRPTPQPQQQQRPQSPEEQQQQPPPQPQAEEPAKRSHHRVNHGTLQADVPEGWERLQERGPNGAHGIRPKLSDALRNAPAKTKGKRAEKLQIRLTPKLAIVSKDFAERFGFLRKIKKKPRGGGKSRSHRPRRTRPAAPRAKAQRTRSRMRRATREPPRPGPAPTDNCHWSLTGPAQPTEEYEPDPTAIIRALADGEFVHQIDVEKGFVQHGADVAAKIRTAPLKDVGRRGDAARREEERRW